MLLPLAHRQTGSQDRADMTLCESRDGCRHGAMSSFQVAPTLTPGETTSFLGMHLLLSCGAGCHVWDADGNEFIEYGMGLGSVTLGHAFEPVVESHRQMLLGSNFTRLTGIEVDYAEELLRILTNADMVKFAKNQ